MDRKVFDFFSSLVRDSVNWKVIIKEKDYRSIEFVEVNFGYVKTNLHSITIKAGNVEWSCK